MQHFRRESDGFEVQDELNRGLTWVQDKYEGTFAEVVPVDPATLPPVAPQAVTMRQARLALLQTGKLAQVNSTIAALTGPEGEAAQIAWEFSSMVERNQALVTSIGQLLSMTSEEIDQLFVTAAAL